MSSNRINTASNQATIRLKLDDSDVSKERVPASAEISELMGRTTPINAYSDLGSSREWGKMSALYGITFQNIQSLPSLRGREINFPLDGPQRNQKAALKDFLTYAVSNPSALLKTLPRWYWDAPAADESKAASFFSNLLANIVTTPNILYSFISTTAEVAAKSSGALLTQPFHFLWKGMKFAEPKDNRTGKKLGFFARLARTIPTIFTQPYTNIQASWQGIKQNWSSLAANNKIPRWKKILTGVGLGLKTAAQTVGLGIAAIPGVNGLLALSGWAAGQTLFYASNALSYARQFVDGLTTLAVNAPKALANNPEKATICKAAAKTMGKSALLFLPTVAILAAAIFIPGAQILPALTPLLLAKVLATAGATAAGAQTVSGAINYKFAEANFNKAVSAAATSNQFIANNVATKSKIKAKPIAEKTPLLANNSSDSPNSSPKTTPISKTVTPPSEVSAPHYSTFLELHQGESIQEKIHSLREAFLAKKSNSTTTPNLSAITVEASANLMEIPVKGTTPVVHQHLHWNEHKDNAWVEYKHNDTHQYVSELVAVTNEINPTWILTQALTDDAKRATLQPIIKAGVKALSAAGKPFDKAHLLAFVQEDEALAETLAAHYKKATRQIIHNHYTAIDHEYPTDKLIDLAAHQVESFIKINGPKKTLSISSAWDVNYVEAVMLYAAAKGYKCKNKSAHSVPAFSPAHIETFQNLLEKKPYLGNSHAAQDKPVIDNNKITTPPFITPSN